MKHATDPDGADRTILIRRVFDAPRDLVFAAWTDPDRISAWWGPRGFTTSTSGFSLRPGGAWVYVMHGPDGVDYPNWIVYREVVRPERLVYDHGGGALDTPAHFHVTVGFADLGGRTEVVMRSVFPSTTARDEVVRRYGAIHGGHETLARLAEQLAGPQPPPASERRHFWSTRTFAAPRELVFRAWTDPAMLARWWGPRGFDNPRCEIAAHPGGAIRIDMRAPDGTVHPMHGTVHEVAPPDRLVFTSVAVDEAGAVALEVLDTVTFIEQAGVTSVTVEAVVQRVTGIGAGYLMGIEEGWSQSLDRLIALVAPGAAADHASASGTAADAPTDDRELVTTRLLRAPRERVVRAWTEGDLLARWWGPAGFTNTFHRFEPHAGGQWRFVMHGPDGTDYDNHSVFIEVSPGRIVFDHLGDHVFRVIATFADREGGTEVAFRMRFTSPEACAQARAYAPRCNEENFDRLEAVLATMS